MFRRSFSSVNAFEWSSGWTLRRPHPPSSPKPARLSRPSASLPSASDHPVTPCATCQRSSLLIAPPARRRLPRMAPVPIRFFTAPPSLSPRVYPQVPRLVADLHAALGRGVSTSEAKAWVRALDRLGEGLSREKLLEACLVRTWQGANLLFLFSWGRGFPEDFFGDCCAAPRKDLKKKKMYFHAIDHASLHQRGPACRRSFFSPVFQRSAAKRLVQRRWGWFCCVLGRLLPGFTPLCVSSSKR